jgi:hypothetical protein
VPVYSTVGKLFSFFGRCDDKEHFLHHKSECVARDARRYFIDLGGKEDKVLRLIQDTVPCLNQLIMHSFDCSPGREKFFQNVVGFGTFLFHDECAWINNNGVNLGTLLRDGNATMRRPSIDLSSWLTETVEQDFVVLSMDVDGAEHDIIPKLYRDKTLQLVDVFFGSFYGDKRLSTQSDAEMRFSLLKAGLAVRLWNATELRSTNICAPPPNGHDQTERAVYVRAEAAMDELDEFTKTHTPSFRPRQSSIAQHKYHTRKTRFVFDALRKEKAGAATVCEIGFNAGHSAVLMLEALPKIHIVSFDVIENAYTGPNVEWIAKRYPGRHIFVAGNSSATLPSFCIVKAREVRFCFCGWREIRSNAILGHSDAAQCFYSRCLRAV